jgi:hypothetical protein
MVPYSTNQTDSFFIGGNLPASAFKEASSSSTLCFVPPGFDCGVGECDDLTPCLGSVDWDECISGVPLRSTQLQHPDASPFRRRADNKLFVEATASARDVAWYICQEKEKKKKSLTTKINQDYANILDHPSLSRSSRPNLSHPQEILT